MRKSEIFVLCKICKKEFKVQLYRIKKGTGKYCSRKCFYISAKGKPQSKHIIKECLNCNKEFRTYNCLLKKGFGKYCSHECMPQRFRKGHTAWNKGKKSPKITMQKHPQWKGGITQGTRGYIYIKKPSHPKSDKRGYIRRSYLVMEKIIGRPLNKNEVVHHKGINFPISSIENRQDDSPENLKLFKNQSEHMKFHNFGKN